MPEHYELSDLEILSVGLVERGAVSIENDMDGNPTGVNFFLLKNEEGQMPDEVKIEEATEPQTELQPESTGDVENPDHVEAAAAGQGQPEVEPEEVTPDEVEKSLFERFKAFLQKNHNVDPAPVVEAEQPNIVEDNMPEVEIAKGQQQTTDVEAILKAVEDKYEAKIEALVEKASRAEDEAARANERADKADAERERREWIEKANELTLALPVRRDEMADKLQAIAKAAPDQIEWLVELLKAADHQLTEAGLFNEFGTSQSPEDQTVEQKIEKSVAEGKSYQEALLTLTKAEQEQMLAGWRK